MQGHRSQMGAMGGLGLAFEITANRFLHHMVRYLMGTMVDIGRKRRPLEDIAELLLPAGYRASPPPPRPPLRAFS